MNMSYERVF